LRRFLLVLILVLELLEQPEGHAVERPALLPAIELLNELRTD
jgi:hypothetical protein